MAFTASDLQAFLHLLEEQPQSRAQLRMMLIADELRTLPDRFDRLTEIVGQLAQAQQRTEVRLERLEATVQALADAQQRTEARLERLEATVQALADAQQRTEARLERLEATVQALADAQKRTEEELRALAGEVRLLINWQRGEAGRREGELYERRTVQRAPALFFRGQGGSPTQHHVQQHLLGLIGHLYAKDPPTEEEDPFLSDLIWWKGEQYLAVEASIRVNGDDVSRAAQRAATLQRAGVQAIGVVVGDEWVGQEARRWAEDWAVQWKVGDDLSEGILAFRRLGDNRSS